MAKQHNPISTYRASTQSKPVFIRDMPTFRVAKGDGFIKRIAKAIKRAILGGY